jgi:hypothetical protein
MVLFLSLFIHVLDYVLDKAIQPTRYSVLVKAYTVMLYIVGVSFRDLTERYCITMASRETVRRRLRRLLKIILCEEDV